MPYVPPQPVSCTYGAPMGRRNSIIDPDDSQRYHVRRVPFVDGCYDRGGAYWGGPANLWHAQSADHEFWLYVRAPSRAAAIQMIREEIPNAKFFKE